MRLRFGAGNEVLVADGNKKQILAQRFGVANAWEEAMARHGSDGGLASLAEAPESSVYEHAPLTLALLLCSSSAPLIGRRLSRWCSAVLHLVAPSVHANTSAARAEPNGSRSFWHAATELVLLGLNTEAADLLSLHPAYAHAVRNDMFDPEEYLVSSLVALTRDEVVATEGQATYTMQSERKEWLSAVRALLEDDYGIRPRISSRATAFGAQLVLQALAGEHDPYDDAF